MNEKCDHFQEVSTSHIGVEVQWNSKQNMRELLKNDIILEFIWKKKKKQEESNVWKIEKWRRTGDTVYWNEVS